MKEVIITQISDKGKRLDAYLAQRLKGKFSRSQIKRFIEAGQVWVDGLIRKAHFKIEVKQTIEIILPNARQLKITPEDIPLDIIYEDEDILVVNKKAGMVVHPAPGNPEHTLVNALLFHTKGRLSHLDTSSRPGIVHRLDKEVSGLMVVAKSDRAHQVLVEDFKRKAVKRRYLAFVKGRVPQDDGVISFPIGRSTRDRKKMAVRFLHSKEALTRYKVLKRFSTYTKLELNLETGRTHQIRVHLSHIGYPIIGDTRYGGGCFERIALPRQGSGGLIPRSSYQSAPLLERRGIALYAAELILRHPASGQQLRFVIDMPEELKKLERGLTAI